MSPVLHLPNTHIASLECPINFSLNTTKSTEFVISVESFSLYFDYYLLFIKEMADNKHFDIPKASVRKIMKLSDEVANVSGVSWSHYYWVKVDFKLFISF